MTDEHGDGGRPPGPVSDDDLLFFFETGDSPFYDAAAVAEQFDRSPEWATRRLDSLAAAGELHELRTANERTVWVRDRDTVTLRREDGVYSAHDTTTGVASGGDTRAAALRNLAEAIEVNEGVGVDAGAFTELEAGSGRDDE